MVLTALGAARHWGEGRSIGYGMCFTIALGRGGGLEKAVCLFFFLKDDFDCVSCVANAFGNDFWRLKCIFGVFSRCLLHLEWSVRFIG